jgi:hypothetical protein
MEFANRIWYVNGGNMTEELRKGTLSISESDIWCDSRVTVNDFETSYQSKLGIKEESAITNWTVETKYEGKFFDQADVEWIVIRRPLRGHMPCGWPTSGQGLAALWAYLVFLVSIN